MENFFSPLVASAYLALLGVGIFANTLRIAYLSPPNTPNVFVFLVSACLGSGIAVIHEAVQGRNYSAMEFVTIACTLHVISSFWLWYQRGKRNSVFLDDFESTLTPVHGEAGSSQDGSRYPRLKSSSRTSSTEDNNNKLQEGG